MQKKKQLLILILVVLNLSFCCGKDSWLQNMIHRYQKPYLRIEVIKANGTECYNQEGKECYYAGMDKIEVTGFMDYSSIPNKNDFSLDTLVQVHRIFHSKNYNDSSLANSDDKFCAFSVASGGTCSLNPPMPESQCWCTGSNGAPLTVGKDNKLNFTYLGRHKAQADWSQDGLFLFWQGKSPRKLMVSSIIYLPEILSKPSNGGDDSLQPSVMPLAVIVAMNVFWMSTTINLR